MSPLVLRVIPAALLALAFSAPASAWTRGAQPTVAPAASAPEAPALLHGTFSPTGDAARAAGAPALELAGERDGAGIRLPRRRPGGHHTPDHLRQASRERSRTRALEIAVLAFAERQRAARSGLLSFGSTAPPPTHR